MLSKERILKEQINSGGPVTITDPEMERYFMSSPEAAKLILQSGAFGRGGEIFSLDMGNPIKILDIAKERLKSDGKLLIFSLKTKNNKIPCFKKMRQKLDNSLKRDEKLFNLIKKRLKRTNEFSFNFKVNITKQKYLNMVKSRYISCLLDLNNNEISKGISEIKSRYKNQIKFTDTLKCISYKK